MLLSYYHSLTTKYYYYDAVINLCSSFCELMMMMMIDLLSGRLLGVLDAAALVCGWLWMTDGWMSEAECTEKYISIGSQMMMMNE